MAELGFRTFDDMVGRVERLSCRKAVEHWKARGSISRRSFHRRPVQRLRVRRVRPQTDLHKDHLDWKILEQIDAAIDAAEPVRLEMPIRNVNRTVGPILSNRIVKRHGAAGLPDGTIDLTFRARRGRASARSWPAASRCG